MTYKLTDEEIDNFMNFKTNFGNFAVKAVAHEAQTKLWLWLFKMCTDHYKETPCLRAECDKCCKQLDKELSK